MVNSWSLLYDELKMDEYPYSENDFLMVGADASPDTINFSSDAFAAAPAPVPAWGAGKDHISFTGSHVKGGYSDDVVTFDLNMPEKIDRRYKYSEGRILKELTEYISATYNQHYSAGDDKIQTLDLIEACGDGEAFCRSNILKYASRYDKKGSARRDIMKILHYAVLLMHFNDKNAQRETYPQR